MLEAKTWVNLSEMFWNSAALTVQPFWNIWAQRKAAFTLASANDIFNIIYFAFGMFVHDHL